MHDVAVTLNGEGFGHLDAADFGDAANVVAGQINQHDVLGTFFGVVDEFDFGGFVGFWRDSSRARTRQRAYRDFLCRFALMRDGFLAYQNFRTRTNDVKIAKIVVIHVRRWVQRTQGAVQAEWGLGVALFDALTDLNLHEIATRNQLFGAQHSGDVICLGEVAHSWVGGGGADFRGIDTGFEHVLQSIQTRFGHCVGVGLGRVGVHNQGEFAAEVVNHRQLFALQEQDVGAVQLVGRTRFLQFFLDVAHCVIPKIAGQTTAKARHAGLQRNFETLLVQSNEVQRVEVAGFNDDTVGDDFGFRVSAKAARPQQSPCWQADEAVAAKALATHHRFK